MGRVEVVLVSELALPLLTMAGVFAVSVFCVGSVGVQRVSRSALFECE